MAMTKWGRKESIIWPPHSPIYTYGAAFMALVLAGLFLYCRFTFGNSPLQRFYTPTYIRSSVAGAIGTSRRDNYRMLMVGARGIQPRLATNNDVTDGTTPQPGGKPIPLALSQPALQHGYTILYLGPEQKYIDASLNTISRVRFTVALAFSISTSSRFFWVCYHSSSSSHFPSPRTFDDARR